MPCANSQWLKGDNKGMENLQFEKINNIGIITISRPKFLNALNTKTIEELEEIIDSEAKDAELFCLIITGSGDKAFVAGADISEMKDMDAFEAKNFSIIGNRVFRKIELLNKPVIAAINGYALGGGCELLLSCDLRIASENAVFGQPEVTLGITPGFGGTQRFVRTVGVGMAKEIIYTGKTIRAEEALRIGLVNRLVPKENLMEEAIKLAKTIASNAPIAVRSCKSVINRGLQCDIDTAISYESEVFAQCFISQDQKDAMNAFVQKKKLDHFNNK